MQELAVVWLVAGGRTNAGVGTELFVTSRTVELLRMLETLGLGSAPSEPRPHGDEYDEH